MVATRILLIFLLLTGPLCLPCMTSRAQDFGLELFQSGLESGGFTVQEGATIKADPLHWVDEGIIDSAAGNNAGQPYKILQIPLLPSQNQTDDQKAFGIFMMRPDEAIVYVGPTPPKCDYFSFTPFVFVRHKNPILTKGDWLFAAVGDPLNNAIIKTKGGSPFGANTMVIFTADEHIYQRIYNIAQSAGYGASMINRYVIPSTVVNLGISTESDSLVILMRTANFKNQTQADNYLNNPSYATVLRVTPNPASKHLEPYAWPDARVREVGPEGGVLNAELRAGLHRLKAAIIKKTPHVSSQSYESVRWFYDSRDVLPDDPESPAYRKFVAGESSDTPYLRTSENGEPANFILGPNDMVVVYGVNHAATRLATYSSFGVYGDWQTNVNCVPNYIIGCNDRIWNGVAGMTSLDFTGSAEVYIPRDPMAPYLYAVRVVRGSCPERDKYCTVLPEPTLNWWVTPSVPGTSDGVGLDQPATVGYRAYLNPKTKSGPSYRDIIPDWAIWFNLR